MLILIPATVSSNFWKRCMHCAIKMIKTQTKRMCNVLLVSEQEWMSLPSTLLFSFVVFVRKGGDGNAELVLLDHGLYEFVFHKDRVSLCNLYRAIILRDEDRMVQHSNEMGVEGTKVLTFYSSETKGNWLSSAVVEIVLGFHCECDPTLHSYSQELQRYFSSCTVFWIDVSDWYLFCCMIVQRPLLRLKASPKLSFVDRDATRHKFGREFFRNLTPEQKDELKAFHKDMYEGFNRVLRQMPKPLWLTFR